MAINMARQNEAVVNKIETLLNNKLASVNAKIKTNEEKLDQILVLLGAKKAPKKPTKKTVEKVVEKVVEVITVEDEKQMEEIKNEVIPTEKFGTNENDLKETPEPKVVSKPAFKKTNFK